MPHLLKWETVSGQFGGYLRGGYDTVATHVGNLHCRGIEKRGLGPKPPMVERGHPKHYIAKAGGSHAIQFGVQSC